MKQTIQMQKIQEQMKPGIITLEGFLGKDTRNLIDILNDDDQTVRSLGYTHYQIAQKMLELRDAGMKGLGEFINIPPYFEVRVDSVRGKLPCPFGDPGIFPKTNIIIKNNDLNKQIYYTDLHIHMIGTHGFYEGKGSPFRLEPKELIEVLEVELNDNPIKL